ncbi:MAG: hypothetical protein A2Y86_08295 [Candidatus Aminicenantes bacterium RBG_13_62_12]|nr:MAG: hypothetical protein A2Y86_08295 [Candidatus Aminicenantes bacterium RBG_13_62_12]
MAKITVPGSAYRVARGKGEMARDNKWQKTAKLTTKKDREWKKGEPAGKSIEKSEVRNPIITPVAEDPGSSVQGKASEPIVPAAPDKNTKRS